MTVENVGVAVAVVTLFLGVVAVVAAAVTRWWLSKGNETDRFYKSAIEGLTADNAAKDLTIARQQGEIEVLKRTQAQQADQIKLLTNMVTAKEDIAALTTTVTTRFTQVDDQLREIRGLVGGTRAGEIRDRRRSAD